jgi:hypothetical protein
MSDVVQRVSQSVQGCIYDLKHLGQLPGASSREKLRFALTRENRVSDLTLVVALGITAFALFACVMAGIEKSRRLGPGITERPVLQPLTSDYIVMRS